MSYMNSDHPLLKRWSVIKTMINNLDLDVSKASRENASAAVRVRQTLRKARTLMKDLIDFSVDLSRKDFDEYNVVVVDDVRSEVLEEDIKNIYEQFENK